MDTIPESWTRSRKPQVFRIGAGQPLVRFCSLIGGNRMPAERLSMHKMKGSIRLKFELGLKNREIARSCLIPHTTVANYLRRARDAGLTWPLPPDLDEGTLERQLFGDDRWARTRETRLPDFASVHEAFRRHRHVSLQLLSYVAIE